MDSGDIHYAARDIAKRLHEEMKSGRITRVGFDSVRCAVAGYLVGRANGDGSLATKQQLEDLENLALRKFVEACP